MQRALNADRRGVDTSNLFQTDDGQFYQAILALNRLVLVRMVVERLALTSEGSSEWEWMVWPVDGPWQDCEVSVQGTETTLAAAKRQAFEAGISMFADLTRDRALYLTRCHSMRSVNSLSGAAMMVR